MVVPVAGGGAVGALASRQYCKVQFFLGIRKKMV